MRCRWRRSGGSGSGGAPDPGGSLEAWTAGLAGQAGADRVAGTLLALRGVASQAGVVCLVGHDMPGFEPAAGLTPWIKGLYVIPPARRRGVGGLLSCDGARHGRRPLAARPTYLYAERGSAAQALYQRRGWRTIHVGRYGEHRCDGHAELVAAGRRLAEAAAFGDGRGGSAGGRL